MSRKDRRSRWPLPLRRQEVSCSSGGSPAQQQKGVLLFFRHKTGIFYFHPADLTLRTFSKAIPAHTLADVLIDSMILLLNQKFERLKGFSRFSCVFISQQQEGSRRSPQEVDGPAPAAAPEPNCGRPGHTPDETTHAAAKLLAQQKPFITLGFSHTPPWRLQPGALSCCHLIQHTGVGRQASSPLALFGSQYFCK